MDSTAEVFARVNEDGTFSILARLSALEGSGDEVVPGKGNVIRQADVSTITGNVYLLGANKNNPSPTEVTPAPTLSAGDNVFDTLRTVGWEGDSYGYNYRHDVGVLYTAEPDSWYRFADKVTLTTGTVMWVRVRAKTNRVQT